MMIGQLRPNYVHNLNLYLKTLEQRNNYLRQIKELNKPENMQQREFTKFLDYIKSKRFNREVYDESIYEPFIDIFNSIFVAMFLSNRSKDDWCITYIVDGCFEHLYDVTKEQYPKELQDRIKII